MSSSGQCDASISDFREEHLLKWLTLNAPIATKVAIGAVRSGSMLFASILNSSVMLGNYLQQMTSADHIFRCIFFLALSGLKDGKK